MNRIYRLIWNTALSCWMVASEHTKGCSKRARTVGAATLAVALALSTPVYADEPPEAGGEADVDSHPVLPQSVRDPFALPRASLFDPFEDRSLHWQSALVTDSYYENSTLSGDYSMVLGSRSAVTGNYAVGLGNRVTVDGHQATAVGTLAVARGAGATAFGTGATATNTNALALARESAATGNDAVAIGFSTRATGDWASAIGAWSQASGRYALAVGGSARATADYGTALGASSRAAGHSSVAIGSSSQAVGEYSVAIGDGTNVANTAANGVAIGRGAALGAGASRAVALGHDSVADQPDVVSVGSASVKRKIINVADGVVADKSTEVVNGGQLFNAMNKQFSGATVTMGDKAAVNGGYGVAIGAGSSVTTHGGVGGVALGHGATAGSPGYSGGIAVGGGARSTFDGVSLGHNAEATATRSIALGTASIANESHTVSVGSSSLQRRIVNVAAGNLSSSSNDAVTGKQLFQTNETLRATQATANVAQQQLNGTSVHIGSGATASAGQSIAMGDRARAEATASVAVGQQARASGPGALALGHASFATGQQSIAAGLRASADGQSAMALGMDASASGNYTTAFGHEAKASGAWTNAIGYMADASGSSSVAIGSLAKSTGTHSVAMGDRAEVNSAAKRGVALGYSAGVRAGATESVALGYGSVATEKHVVSVGSSAVKRRIVNLAEGSETATSNEAITGAQLHRTQQSVTAVDGKATAAARTAADAATAATSAATAASTAKAVADAAALRLDNASTRLGQRATAGTNASALGNDAAASGSHSNAIGNAASSAGANAIAVGTLAAGASSSAVAVGNRAGVDAAASGGIALGANAKVNASASDAIALGAGSVATIKETVSVGSSGLKRRIVNVADGILSASSTDAVTGRQLFAATQRLDTAEGTLRTTTTTANTAKTTADKADGNATNALNKANVLGGLLSQAAAAGDVRLGADNTGTVLDVRNKADKGRVIRGLAAGAVNATSTDAVNGGQLYSQQLKVDANDRRIDANLGSIATNQTNISTNQTEIAGNRGSIGVNGEAIAKLRSDFDAYAPELEGVVMFNEDRTRVDIEGARISGVQDGDVSLGSRDAVTGGQLFSTNSRIAEIEADATFVSLGEMLGSEGASAGLLGIAMGAFAEASLDGEGGVALGSFAAARGTNSIALGRGSHALAVAEEGFAMGTRSTVRAEGGLAAGARSEILSGATYSVALGYGSVAGEASTISVGSESVKRRVVNVARGRKVDDATTFGQLRDSLEKLGGGADVGASGEIVGPVYQLKSGDYTNVGAALTALDGRVSTTRDSVDILDARLNRLFHEETSARTDDPGRLNLGGAQGMVLGNVANGMIAAGSRDAVNGGQLYATNQHVGQNRDAISGLREELSGVGKNAARSLMKSDGPSFNFGGSRLSGVGAGDISSADSTDAINGGQLFVTNDRVSVLEEQGSYFVIGSDEFTRRARAGTVAVAIGDSAEASLSTEGATAVGSFAKARGKNSVALGRAAHVHEGALQGFALGAASQVEIANGVALGAGAIVGSSAPRSVSLGYASIADEADTVSVGHWAYQRRIVNVANGTADHDAATVGQLKRIASAFGGSVEVDANGNPTAPSFNVQGGEYRSVGDALSALDSSVNDTDKSVGALDNRLNRLLQEDATARTDGPGRLSLGGANGMILGNVANGMISAGSRDAVNGGQLYEVRKDLQGQIDSLVDGEKRAAVSGRMAAPAPMSAEGGGDAVASADAPVATPTPTPTPTPGASEASAPEPVVKAEGDTAVAVGSVGKERSVKHVAKGTADTDAVNVAQLNDVLVRSNEYTDQAVEGLNKRLDGMDKRFNRMAAMSSAQSAMAMNTAGLNTYNRLGAGVGHSDGESALAVGYQRVMNERGSATFSLNGAFTNSGEKTVGVGVGIGW